jgi:hypothetical protein
MGGDVARMREMRNAYNFLVEKLDGKNRIGRPRHKRKANIKMSKKIGWDWIILAQDRNQWPYVGNRVMNLRVL